MKACCSLLLHVLCFFKGQPALVSATAFIRRAKLSGMSCSMAFRSDTECCGRRKGTSVEHVFSSCLVANETCSADIDIYKSHKIDVWGACYKTNRTWIKTTTNINQRHFLRAAPRTAGDAPLLCVGLDPHPQALLVSIFWLLIGLLDLIG